jgi:hypothetical protein
LDEVGDVVFLAGLHDDLGEGGVMDMGDAGEEVMFDLVIEAATVPSDQAVIGGKIHSGFGLMLVPISLDAVGFFVELWEGGFFDAMRHLKDNGEDQPLDEGGCEVEEQDRTEAVEEEREGKHPRHEDDLA